MEKNRLSLFIACIIVTLAVTGCNGDPGSEFIGKWSQVNGNGKIEITRSGVNFRLTKLPGSSSMERVMEGIYVLTPPGNLSVAGMALISYEKENNQLLVYEAPFVRMPD